MVQIWSQEHQNKPHHGSDHSSTDGTLRARLPGAVPESQEPEGTRGSSMRRPKRWGPNRRMLVPVVVLLLVCLVVVSLPLFDSEPTKPLEWHVDPAHRQLVHTYVRHVLDGECRPGKARKSLEALLPGSSDVTQPFLWNDMPLPDDLFSYPPPFGFKGLKDKLEELLKLLPSSDSAPPLDGNRKCRRCVVIGNGGILRGLELGPLINQFDIIIRLNSGPLGEFSRDVGNRTSIRMSYPEGTPTLWADTDRHTLFVAVVYKAVDINWIKAMVNKQDVALLDWLFFWQKVPDQIPLEPGQFRLLNLQVIREAAMDYLHYAPPRPLLWGWDQNVPTIGMSALNLASLLCDEVSLAGFGYNLSQQGAPLHYYDNKPMSSMQKETMHNVDKEGQLLRRLAKEGAITDLTGGLHCPFCPS